MRKVQFLSILFLSQASMLWSSNSEFWLLTTRPTNANRIKLPADYHTVLYADDEDLHGRSVLQSGELIVSKYVHSRINNNDCGTFRPRRPLPTACKTVLYTVDKGICGRNVLQSLLLILLRICSRSVRPISTK